MPPLSTTTQNTTMHDESQRQAGFYVPRFEVKIEGAGLPRDVLFDVREITYEDSISSIDSFKMTINNWDEVKRECKYIGSETKEQLQKGNSDEPRLTLFEPCGKEVTVRMGYGANLVTMLTGQFTTMEPSFADGGATMKVTGLNVLHQLRRKQYTTTWPDKTDSEVALDISKRSDKGKKRFPLPIVIDDNAKGKEKQIPIISEHNQYDIDFLFQRARERGYVVFIQEADASKNQPRQLYFGPSHEASQSLRPVVFELAWGASLIEFKPKITTANQVKSVTVRGWHRTRKTPITRTVTIDDERLNVNKDLHRLLNACEGREEIVVDEPIFTNCQARERAIAILLSQTKEIVTADVKVVGLADLRSGQMVKIDKLGARLNGMYMVTKTSHTIDDDGYITTFSCRREELGSGK